MKGSTLRVSASWLIINIISRGAALKGQSSKAPRFCQQYLTYTSRSWGAEKFNQSSQYWVSFEQRPAPKTGEYRCLPKVPRV